MHGTATVLGKEKWAHIPGANEIWYIRIPRDDDTNHIADAWAYNTGEATDDNETSPAGDGTNGDGFTRYQEYRGFMINEVYTRLNATNKDVFLCDLHSLGYGDFDATGLTIRMLKSDESEYDANRVVNFNRDTAPGHTQCAIRMLDGEDHEDFYGEAQQLGTPNECEWVKIYTDAIADDDPGGLYTQMKKCVIGHECGHDVNIPHHAPVENYWYQGDPDCVMYQPFDWNNIAHDYCTEDDDCAHSWKLH